MTVLKEILNSNKHILIVGKSEFDRNKYLNEILLNTNLECIRFPKPLDSIYKYIETVQKKELFHPCFPSKKSYNFNQILDYHRDWIIDNRSLLVLEEIQELEERWKIELMKMFINNLEENKNSGARCIITMENENMLFQNLLTKVAETNDKNSKQVIESNLLIVNL